MFVVDGVDPRREDAFEPFKAELLASLDAPELVGRLEWVQGARATDLPTRIEAFEEAASRIAGGLAAVAARTSARRTRGATRPRDPSSDSTRGRRWWSPGTPSREKTPRSGASWRRRARDPRRRRARPPRFAGDAEIAEAEKAALGAAIGASMSHLLAWTRHARRLEEDPKNAARDAFVLDASARLKGGAPFPAETFVEILDAVAAYRPEDADVVFLSGGGGAEEGGSPEENSDESSERVSEGSDAPFHARLTRRGWGKVGRVDLRRVARRDSLDDLGGALFYLVTETFATERMKDLVEAGGFGFHGEWLAERCGDGRLRCYAASPALARAPAPAAGEKTRTKAGRGDSF